MKAFSEPRSRHQLGWLAMACVWLAGLALAAQGGPIGDEWVHWLQVRRFQDGDFRVYEEWLTNIPGYHWMMATLLWPFGTTALFANRTVVALFTALAVVLVHRIRSRLHPEDAQRTAAQFLLLPTMYLYGFLAYTDLPALAFLLGALLASIHERHGLSALLLVASMAMRQNNVLWVVFLGAYSSWPLLCVGARTLRARCLPARAWWRALLQKVWPYLLAFACFCLYWASNGSIAYSTAQSAYSHPDFRPDIGNPIFLLVVLALLFPFQMLAGWAVALASGRLLPVLALAACVFLAGFFLFRVEHPSNLFAGNARNQVLLAVAAGGWPRWAFSLLVAFAAGGLALLPHLSARARLWLPFSILFVAASWMIETRYTIVPLTLFLLFRRPQPAWQERLMLAVWAVLALGLAGSVFDGKLLV